MLWLKIRYQKYRNGIIFTLIFHILFFLVLNIIQFRTKLEFHETELLIDFPGQMITNEVVENELSDNDRVSENNSRTNIASNLAAKNNTNKVFDSDFQNELERAQNLVKDVKRQLSKEIPTVDDLQMPEKTSEGLYPDSIMKKLYSGESNVEYYLKNRYHLRLLIPVYLAQFGGNVKVNIVVDRSGNVISAKPEIGSNSNELLLSYAKTAAVRTKFNADNGAELQQKGYIIYHFVAQ